jgi:hypothetical protein
MAPGESHEEKNVVVSARQNMKAIVKESPRVIFFHFPINFSLMNP